MEENSSAKIVANSTDRTWSQAYSTSNFYAVISIEHLGERKENPASVGRDLLEKLQREFFAIDEKNLSQIKGAVMRTVENLGEEIECSLVVSHIQKNALYIVIGGEGYVALKRNEKIGIAAQGEKGNIISFSGFLKDKDIIVLATSGFSQKIDSSQLSGLLTSEKVTDIAENIAPMIHGSSTGTESCILISYKAPPLYAIERDEEKEADEDEIEDDAEEDSLPEERRATNHEEGVIDSDAEDEEEETFQTETNESRIPQKITGIIKHIPVRSITQFPQSMKHMPSLSSTVHTVTLQKKQTLFVAIILLVLLLVFGIFYEKKQQDSKKIQAQYNEVYTLAQKKMTEGNDLLSLDRSAALQEYTDAQNILNDNKNRFAENSTERKKIDEMLQVVMGKMQELESGSVVQNKKTIFTNKDSKLIKSIGSITLKGGDLLVSDTTTGSIVVLAKNDGKISKEFELSLKNPMLLAGDESNVYIVVKDGVYKIDKGNKKSASIITLKDTDISGIDTFGSNLYLANKTDKTVDKYQGANNYQKVTYLQSPEKLPSPPVSMSIDGSVWMVLDNGTIHKFTKGNEDEFSMKGNAPGKNSLLYTDSDYQNIYIFDKDSKKIIIVSKQGELKNALDVKNLGSIISFAVDESNKKIYTATSSELYTFDF